MIKTCKLELHEYHSKFTEFMVTHEVQAIMKLTEGDAKSTIDPRVEATIANVTAVEKILELALICLAPQRQNRPTMQRCAEILWSIRKDFRELLAADACPFSPSTQRSNSIGRATLHH